MEQWPFEDSLKEKEERAENISEDDSSDSETEGADLSHVSDSSYEDKEKKLLFLKCSSSLKSIDDFEEEKNDIRNTNDKEKYIEQKEQQTDIKLEDLQEMEAEINRLEAKFRIPPEMHLKDQVILEHSIS